MQNSLPVQVAIYHRKRRTEKKRQKICFFHTMRFLSSLCVISISIIQFCISFFSFSLYFPNCIFPIQNEVTFSLWPSATGTPGTVSIISVLHSKIEAHWLPHLCSSRGSSHTHNEAMNKFHPPPFFFFFLLWNTKLQINPFLKQRNQPTL